MLKDAEEEALVTVGVPLRQWWIPESGNLELNVLVRFLVRQNVCFTITDDVF